MKYKFKGVSSTDNKLIYCETNEKPIFEKRGRFGVLKWNDGEIYSWSCCASTGYHYNSGSDMYGGDKCEAIINGIPTYGKIGFHGITYEPEFIPFKVDETYGNLYYDVNHIPLSEITSDNIEFKEEEYTPERIEQCQYLIDLTNE